MSREPGAPTKQGAPRPLPDTVSVSDSKGAGQGFKVIAPPRLLAVKGTGCGQGPAYLSGPLAPLRDLPDLFEGISRQRSDRMASCCRTADRSQQLIRTKKKKTNKRPALRGSPWGSW